MGRVLAFSAQAAEERRYGFLRHFPLDVSRAQRPISFTPSSASPRAFSPLWSLKMRLESWDLSPRSMLCGAAHTQLYPYHRVTANHVHQTDADIDGTPDSMRGTPKTTCLAMHAPGPLSLPGYGTIPVHGVVFSDHVFLVLRLREVIHIPGPTSS